MAEPPGQPNWIESISAVTLMTADMERAVRFYHELGFELRSGGPAASFTTFRVGRGFLNLMVAERRGGAQARGFWGRVIFHVADVDAIHRRAIEIGAIPEAPPHDASWGERYFHVRDPDGHELSFARPVAPG